MNRAHPYIPNAEPQTRQAMLDKVGIDTVDDLFASIPQRLRAPENLGLPPALEAEADLRRYFDSALARNTDTTENLSFLGGGCWTHSVPAVCDEIAGRGEFWSAFMGIAGSTTTGAYQALFEYQSLVAELVGLDLVPWPAYDWGWAASSGLLMAVRVTGRSRVLIADTSGPARRRQIAARLPDRIEIEWVGHDPVTGGVDLDDLGRRVDGAAAFYFETPSYLGYAETELRTIRRLTHEAGCLLVAGVDPTSLGTLPDPGSYDADLAVGDLQPLGLHPTFGGTAAGFMSFRLDSDLVAALPNIYLVAMPTARPDEYDYFWANFDDTSYASRGVADDVIGCGSTMHGIIAAVYLSLMGPQGMAELGQTLRDRAAYLADRLGQVPGVTTARLTGLAFKEFVVDFSETGWSVERINAALLDRGIFGGIALEADFPELSGCALYSVTEKHTRDDLDRLATTLEEILR
ncbi:aminomethyl-transferring glycine dehydrogenase subunit GcvPA [Rhodococcus sp. T2V]|uniref:aminomethyl-transferring glycine dehydrogenase subunit GcvPA n=1 Tax=Rhodococcus sp. T2V TaxID=3034164 RepID=UPI0023E2888F|nr:aminomethyl-transferring glycine dehydrogenase subunit GcvPA [Rhodococcus sp. T2V]MDF3311635.1 aminomethyl-transferring glycine dehydrogenase subunit GcvPA [Rhodococcus sp. T2V]